MTGAETVDTRPANPPNPPEPAGRGARRVVLLTNAPAPYTHAFTEALRRLDVDATIVARQQPADIGRGWSVHDRATVITAGPWNDGRAVAHLLWRDGETHVIITGSYTTATDAVRRALSSVAPNVSVLFWGERLRPGSRRTDALRRRWFSAPGLDGVLAIGSRAVSTYRAVTPPSRPVHVLPYTTDSGLDLPHRPADHPTIGYAGRLLPHKGVESLLEGAAALAVPERPRLEIAGTGPDDARLRRLAVHLGLADRTIWLGDLDQGELARRRQTWWAQAVPSRASEGWGVVVNEALNSGVPVLASRHVHAAADLVRDGENGRIIAADGNDGRVAWSTAIGEACAPDVLARRSREARRVAEAFAPDRAAAWLLDLYDAGPRVSDRSFVDDAWATIT